MSENSEDQRLDTVLRDIIRSADLWQRPSLTQQMGQIQTAIYFIMTPEGTQKFVGTLGAYSKQTLTGLRARLDEEIANAQIGNDGERMGLLNNVQQMLMMVQARAEKK